MKNIFFLTLFISNFVLSQEQNKTFDPSKRKNLVFYEMKNPFILKLLVDSLTKDTLAIMEYLEKPQELPWFWGRTVELRHGKVRRELSDNGYDIIGTEIYYYPNGSISVLNRYLKDSTITTYFYENGNIKAKEVYIEIPAFPKESVFDPIKEADKYRYQQLGLTIPYKNGWWLTYNEDGSLLERKRYDMVPLDP